MSPPAGAALPQAKAHAEDTARRKRKHLSSPAMTTTAMVSSPSPSSATSIASASPHRSRHQKTRDPSSQTLKRSTAAGTQTPTAVPNNAKVQFGTTGTPQLVSKRLCTFQTTPIWVGGDRELFGFETKGSHPIGIAVSHVFSATPLFSPMRPLWPPPTPQPAGSCAGSPALFVAKQQQQQQALITAAPSLPPPAIKTRNTPFPTQQQQQQQQQQQTVQEENASTVPPAAGILEDSHSPAGRARETAGGSESTASDKPHRYHLRDRNKMKQTTMTQQIHHQCEEDQPRNAATKTHLSCSTLSDHLAWFLVPIAWVAGQCWSGAWGSPC